MWLKCSNAHRLCRQCRQCGYHSAAGDMVMHAGYSYMQAIAGTFSKAPKVLQNQMYGSMLLIR